MRCIAPTLVLTLLGLLVGCSDTPGSRASQDTDTQTEVEMVGSPDVEFPDMETAKSPTSAEPESTSLSEVQEKVGEAVEATGEFSEEQMRKFGKTMRTKVDDLDDKLEGLSRRGEELAGDAKKRWQERVTALRDRRQQLQNEVNQLRDASGDAWKSLKEGIENAWTDLQQAVDQTADGKAGASAAADNA